MSLEISGMPILGVGIGNRVSTYADRVEHFCTLRNRNGGLLVINTTVYNSRGDVDLLREKEVLDGMD
jgi:hypothetical protein